MTLIYPLWIKKFRIITQEPPTPSHSESRLDQVAAQSGVGAPLTFFHWHDPPCPAVPLEGSSREKSYSAL